MDGLCFLLFAAASAEIELSVVTPQVAFVGSEVLLRCHFDVGTSPLETKYLAIIWKNKANELLKFSDEISIFEPRASIDEKGIQHGNASLKLSNLFIYDEGIYTCSIIYSPNTQEKSIALTLRARPQVTITDTVVIKGRENMLRCSVFGFYPEKIDVSWLRDGQILPGSSMSKLHRYANGTFSVNGTVPIIPRDGDASVTFSCLVRHISLQTHLQVDAHLLVVGNRRGRIVAKLMATLLVIVAIVGVGLFLYKRSTIFAVSEIQVPNTCTVGEGVELVCTGHHCPKNTEARWQKVHKGVTTDIQAATASDAQEGVPLLPPNRYNVKTNIFSKDGVYHTITSTLVIIEASRSEDEGAIFKCILTGEKKVEKESKPLRLSDFDGHLLVADMTVPRIINGVAACFQCKVSGYFPNELKVEWLKLDKETNNLYSIPEDRGGPSTLTNGASGYKMEQVDLTCVPRKGYSCTACLTFTPDLNKDQGTEYICRVSHPTLKEAVERKTGKLTVLGTPKVDPSNFSAEKLDHVWMLTLEVEEFYAGKGSIQWACASLQGPKSLPSTTNKEEHIYTAKSVCPIKKSLKKRIGEHPVTVTIEHETLSAPLVLTVSWKDKQKRWEVVSEPDKDGNDHGPMERHHDGPPETAQTKKRTLLLKALKLRSRGEKQNQ